MDKKKLYEKFSAGLVGDDIFNWEVIIIGPPETAYEGSKIICLKLTF